MNGRTTGFNRSPATGARIKIQLTPGGRGRLIPPNPAAVARDHPGNPEATMSEFYDIDSTKVSHREYWNESPLVAPIGWTLKWLRVRMPCSTDDPNVDSTLPFLINALPDWTAEQFRPYLTALTSLGFHSPVYHLIHDPGTQTTQYWATFLHRGGVHFASVRLRHWDRAANTKRKPFVVFYTGFLDTTFLVTTGAVDFKRHTGASAEKLWALHEQRLLSGGRGDLAGVGNRDELLWSIERYHIVLRDFHLARGVFRPRSGEARATAQAYAERVEQARAGGFEYPEVMAHLNNLQENKPSWTKVLWVLVISAILFLAAGAAQWDWKFTLWLIPVLFFHEAGHWIAMRIFKYRNLRMFFIPFFGAAVTGQNWNVPGWKKAIVSLAGPMPGILLGCTLTVVAIIVQQPWLNQLALILLLLNAFNLLPVLPLDGGHVLQAVLFCRNRWLDGAFRVLAVLGLIGLALLDSGRLMIPLVIIMALSLPLAFKLAKVADDLRGAGLPPPLPGEDRIHPQTAHAIITAVKTAVPKATSNKMLAQHTINVFETLNARPPGVLVTLAFLFTHGAGVVLSVVFGMLLVVNMHGGLGNFFKAAVRLPQYHYDCGTSQTWQGRDLQATKFDANNLLVVTLEEAPAAATAFTDLTNRLPQTAGLTQFGHSLFLKLPVSDDDAREKWFDEFQSLATNATVLVSNSAVMVNLSFLAPTAAAATNLAQTLECSLLGVAGMHLIAPWSPEARQPGYDAKLAARRQWQRIDEELSEIWTNAGVKELQKKSGAAYQRGARAEATRLQEEQQKLVKELQAQLRERLGADTEKGVDRELLALHAQLEQLDYTNRTERIALLRQVAAKLGEVAYDGDHPAPNALAQTASFGTVSQTGLLIELNWMTLPDAAVGLPLLAEWLCEQGCSTVKYQFQPGYLNNLLGGLHDPDQD
jgi:Zn-dependent protease